MGSGSSEDWRDGFLFLGNHLALDFLNTLPPDRRRPPGASARYRVARSLACRGRTYRPRRREASSPSMGRSSRRAAASAVELSGKPPQGSIAARRGGASFCRFCPRDECCLARSSDSAAAAQGRGFPRSRRLFPAGSTAGMLAPLAGDVVSLLTTVDPSRLRQCQTCVLHFYDASKKGTRVWCSMNLCGNRAKVAAYSARKRSALSAG